MRSRLSPPSTPNAMLQLSNRSHRFVKHPYVCTSCLAALTRPEPLPSTTPASLLRRQQFSSTPASSVRIRKITSKEQGKKKKKSASKAETPTADPSQTSNGKSQSPGNGPSKASSGPSEALKPTSLKDALSSLRDVLENRAAPTTKASGTPGSKQHVPLAKAMKKVWNVESPQMPLEAVDVPKEEPKKKKKKSKKAKSQEALKIASIESKELALTPIDKEQPPVPTLSYNLDKVLFNPGVYHLQDPRSRVFNFDPYLAAIMPINEFDFNSLKQYVTSSKDTTLTEIAAEKMKKYAGSTSSMTSMLAHFHFLLSTWRPVNPAHVSRGFDIESTNFTRISRSPAAIFLHWKDGTYAIDADKEFDSANILSMLGKSMEKLLTLSKDDFEKYRRTNSDQLTEEERNGPESYHYTTMGDFMMRSQLDAFDKRLPGTGMFDLKTRAVVSIRMDAKNFHKGLGYEIRRRIGQWESYEREYFDMVRSAFLKYSLQVRMGRMDGIFVAFHNTQRIFGFQYVPLQEMDLALHGTEATTLGDREFKLSLHLLNKVLDKATAKWPEQSLQLHFETRPSDPPFMYVFAKPVTQEEIEAVQTKNKAQVERFEREMMGMIHNEEESAGGETEIIEDEDGSNEVAEEGDTQEETSLDVWEDMMEKVEETLENDELGVNSVREAIEDALEQSGFLQMESTEESRHYLDALLEALTSHVKKGDQAADDQAEVSDKAADEQVDLPSADTAAEAEEQQAEMPWTEEPRVSESEQDVAGREADHASEQDLSQDAAAVEIESEAQPAEGGEGSSKQPSLKDLIVRLAAKFQASPAERRDVKTSVGEGSEEQLSSDSLKLRKFEKILSEMMRKSPELGRPQDKSQQSESGEISADSTSESSLGQEESTTGEKEAASTTEEGDAAKKEEEEQNVLGMVLTIRNKVDGRYVKRPEKLLKTSAWTVEYSIEELTAQRTNRLYEMVLARRRKALQRPDDDDSGNGGGGGGGSWSRKFEGMLEAYSKKGRRFRELENEKAKAYPVRVYGNSEELKWSDVFTDDGGPAVPKPRTR